MAKPKVQEYLQLSQNHLLIEGPFSHQDQSYFLIEGQESLKAIERGIPFDLCCLRPVQTKSKH